ncbi:neuropeptide receptor npr-1-like [Saccostrea echinata]|uniref:neuropeptide receptor npr-1-like n=1 Tax=Saccostrea echinata TaxID=191078 RepID=UPI002A7FCD91|nr:neuropeptide receptor npr-1-like [Saccostrea echinata]
MDEIIDEDADDVFDKSIVGQKPVITYVAILMVVGFFGNIHVLVVFSTQFKKNSNYVIFVLSLAVIDFLMCSVHMPLEILDLLYPYDFYDSVTCKLFRSNQSILTITSILILILIAIDRYRHVCHPMRNQWSVSGAKRMIRFCVLLAIVVSIPVPLLFGLETVKVSKNATKTICFLENELGMEYVLPVVYILFLNFAFVCGLVVLLFTYISIGITTRRRAKVHMMMASLMLPKNHVRTSHTKCYCLKCFSCKKLSRVQHHSLKSIDHKRFYQTLSRQRTTVFGRSSSKDNKKATKVLFCVTVIFIVSYLPYVTLGLLLTLGHDLQNFLADPGIVMYRLSVRLLLINHVCNCFVYGIFDQRFKTACFQFYLNLYNRAKMKLTKGCKR